MLANFLNLCFSPIKLLGPCTEYSGIVTNVVFVILYITSSYFSVKLALGDWKTATRKHNTLDELNVVMHRTGYPSESRVIVPLAVPSESKDVPSGKLINDEYLVPSFVQKDQDDGAGCGSAESNATKAENVTNASVACQ